MNYENSPQQIYIALHLMLTKKSEMDFNDKDVLPQEKLSMLLLMIMNHEILGNTDLETINDFVCKKMWRHESFRS